MKNNLDYIIMIFNSHKTSASLCGSKYVQFHNCLNFISWPAATMLP